MKSTKSDVEAGRERSQGMWMDTYETYLQHVLGGAGGSQDDAALLSSLAQTQALLIDELLIGRLILLGATEIGQVD